MKNSLLLTLVLGLTLTAGAGAASNNSPSLHDAIKAGKPSAVKEALTRARINEYNAAGMTPLMVAAMYDRSTSARILLTAGADANLRTAQYGTTALMMAAMNGYHEVVAELIQGGAALNMGNKSGFTALMLAAQKGHATVVQQLLQAGADPQVQDASHRTALQHAATDEIRSLLNTPLGTQAGAPLPGMVEAIEQLRKLQGSPVQFAALRFSMSAGDGEQGYLYHFLGQDSFCKLVFAGNEYLVTTQRVFGSFSDNLVALHFWDSRTFSYISSVLHNGPMNGLILFSEDEATGRFAMAFSHKYSRTDGVLAYDIKSDTLEYSVGFDINAHFFNNKGCTPLSFKSSKFDGMPPFKESAGDISLNNTLNLRKIPQLAGLAHNFSATDEETLRSIEFSTLRTIPYTHEEWPRNTDATDIPGLPDGMKAIAVHEEYGRALLRSPYVICIPDTHKDLRTFAWDWEEKGRPETSKSLYIYDLGRKKLYPMPQFILECPTYVCSAWPEFGDSDCEKIVHNTAGVHRSGASWSGAEIFNPQSGKYEKIHFNDSPHESRLFDTTNQAIAYRLDGKVPDADTLGSSLSVLNRVPGKDGYLYWLAAGPGNCALFLIDESTKTGKLVQSWQGAWGRSLWAPNRPNPVWLQEKKWLCLPMKDHCWEIYDLANPTQSTEKKFNVYTGVGRSWAIMLPNGHYAGTPGCESLFYEKKENEQCGIQALAPWRNRPAEVLEAIGGNADDIAALKETTKRWLARQALDVANLPDEPPHAAFPSAEAEKTPLMQEAEQLEMDVKLTAAGKKALTALEVRVDGAYIPQEWENTLLIPRGQSQTVRVKIPLRIGQNNIELTPIDSTALEGERVSFRAVRPGQPESRLFVVTLGVSDYDDDSLDLQFAAKDAKDLAAAFAERGSGEVKSLTLTDKDVADAGVLEKVQTFLSESKAEDRVVLYLAGHGMLDDKLDYHYAPASFDVENVSKTGISMSRLIGMLQSIPARERLLLLDTCHSGQLGEAGEEKLAANGVQLPHGVRAIQHRGMKVKKATGALTTAAQQKRYIEDMFNMGNEYRGVNIVAGAAGAEYALESGEWNNGVFTAAIIQTLQNAWKADQNVDGQLAVDELLHALQNQVQEMTGGAQKPNTVAAENSGMIMAVDICYDITQSDWDAICKRIQKAGSSQEALFILDLIKFYRGGCIYADERWEDTDYSKDTYLSQRGRNYDATQCEHLKKAFLLGQKSPDNKKETVPADVWKAAILHGVSPDTIRKDFNWNASVDSHKLPDFIIDTHNIDPLKKAIQPGFHLAQLVADYADTLSAEQIADTDRACSRYHIPIKYAKCTFSS